MRTKLCSIFEIKNTLATFFNGKRKLNMLLFCCLNNWCAKFLINKYYKIILVFDCFACNQKCIKYDLFHRNYLLFLCGTKFWIRESQEIFCKTKKASNCDETSRI